MAAVFAVFPALLARQGQPAGSLSGGEQQMLSVARAMIRQPRLVLLDEPIAGVNPTLAESIAAHLHRLCSEGTTFLIIEHNMDLIARLCNPVIVMAQGARLTEGGFAEVAADPRVQDAYMGQRHRAAC